MDVKSGSAQSSISIIQSIGKDWGSLRQHEEPVYVKKLREKSKDHRHEQKQFIKTNKPDKPESFEPSHEKGESMSFEITI
jgi:hypothetical protein